MTRRILKAARILVPLGIAVALFITAWSFFSYVEWWGRPASLILALSGTAALLYALAEPAQRM